ncbi:MAG: PAS domain S-box protein [Candidatus Hodarchaeales archaeon]
MIAERQRFDDRFRELAEFLPQMVFEINIEGYFTFANVKGLQSFQYTKADIENGLNVVDLFIEEERKIILRTIEQILGGEDITEEITFTALKKDGDSFPIAIYASPIIEGERRVGIRGIGIDISERQKMEQEILKFKIIADTANYGVAIVTLDGIIEYINQYFAEVHGYDPKELIGKNLSIFHNEKQLRGVININKELRDRGSYSALEIWHTHKDSTTFPMLMNGMIIKEGKSGKPLYMAATAMDLTKHKEYEEEFKTLSKLHKAVLDTSFDGIAVITLEGFLIFANECLVEMSGYSQEKIIDLHLSKITGGSKFCDHLIESATKGQEIVNYSTTLIPQSGSSIPIELSSRLIKDEEKILIVMHDLRVEKRLSDELRLFKKFTTEHIYISLYKFGKKGPTLVNSEEIPFIKDSKDEIMLLMGLYYMTALGQGVSRNIGLYGPLPLPKMADYLSLVYAFMMYDPLEKDSPFASKGQTYCFIALSIPKILIELFSNRGRLESIFMEEIGKITILQNLDLAILKKLKERLIGK